MPGLEERLTEIGLAVSDRGNVVAPEPEATRPRRRAGAVSCRRSSRPAPSSRRSSRRAVREGARPLVLGGDHAIAIGTLARPRRCSRAAGRCDLDRRPRRPQHAGDEPVRERPRDAARRLLSAGRRTGSSTSGFPCPPSTRPVSRSSAFARSTRPSAAFLREAGIRVFTMSDIDRIGIERAMREALDRVAGPGLRSRLTRPRLARPGGRARCRHARARRADLPRGASRLRARRRVGDRRLLRGRRGESDPRP